MHRISKLVTKKDATSFVTVLIVVALVGLVISRNGEDKTTQSDQFVVVTSFYPLYYFASQVAGEYAEVINIGKNSDPHDFTPSAADVVTLQGADIVLLQGAGLESWGEEVRHQLDAAGTPVFVVAERVSLDKTEGNESASGELDPHTWLDPVLAAETVLRIAEEFASVDPVHEDIYRANARPLVSELAQLDAAYRTAFTSCTADEVLVSHDAFGYIARRYGLTMHPIAGISTKDEPSAAFLAELKKEAEEGVLAILTEENSVQDYAETLSRETGISLLPINTLESGGPAGGDYQDGMRTNLAVLKQGYGCTE